MCAGPGLRKHLDEVHTRPSTGLEGSRHKRKRTATVGEGQTIFSTSQGEVHPAYLQTSVSSSYDGDKDGTFLAESPRALCEVTQMAQHPCRGNRCIFP